MKCSFGRIIENDKIINNIYKLEVEFDGKINPGQFFMLKTLDNSFLLPRPISVYDVGENKVVFLYRIEGHGTEMISKTLSNHEIQLFGPLGNGFNLQEIKGKTAVIGGGIGIAPLFYLIKKLKKENTDSYLGFKETPYCLEEFERYSNKVVVATEDGSVGDKGYITNSINVKDYDTIITCGPSIMMEKVIQMCRENDVKVFASLESRMACGIGACLGCAMKTKKGNQRVCKEGPVFNGEELMIY